MARDSRVAWREGLFLRPQHFQQQERFLDSQSLSRSRVLRPYPWGVSRLSINESVSSLGKFAVEACSGVLPDGAPFSIPESLPPPPPLDVPPSTRDAVVFLTLQPELHGSIDFVPRDKPRPDARHLVDEEDVYDSFSSERTSESIELGKLNLNYGITREQTDGRVCLGLARIREVLNGNVIFDRDYIPPCVDIRGAERLNGFLNDIIGRLEKRVEELSLRAVDATDGGAETIASFLMLEALNRSKPVLAHLRALPYVHPERLFETLAELAGDLCTFTRADRAPPDFPSYDHENLQLTFEPLIDCLQKSLSVMIERSAGQWPLENVSPGAYTARIEDHALLQTCNFYLAAAAQVPAETLRSRFAAVVKIGALTKMSMIVRSALHAGVRLSLPTAVPTQIRPIPGYTYFELDRSGQDWEDIKSDVAVGVHVAGDWPGLKLELWWVKRAR
jgi:type VI secretion system protein ImpJ